MHTPNPDALRMLIGIEGVPAGAVGAEDVAGRGQAKLPTGVIVPFQGAGISIPMASTAQSSNRPTVKVQDWQELGGPVRTRRPARPEGDAGPTDLTLLVGALKKAANDA
jgi:hypothetical protein